MEVYDEKLPDELKVEILARVPGISPIFQLRLVCKSWNSLLQSPSFSRLRWQVASPEPWLLTVKGVNPSNQKLYLCDRSMENWLQPRLKFPKSMECDFSTSITAGGMVCCLASESRRGRKSILVFNPLTEAFKMLPPPPFPGEWWSPVLRLCVWRDPTTSHYKVAVCDTRFREVQVYNSKTSNWEAGSDPPLSDGIRPRFEGYRNRRKDKLFWYEMEEDRWRGVKVPETNPLELKLPTIIRGRGGEVKLAAVLAPTNGRNARLTQGFGVWELERHSQQSEEWVEVSRTPSRLWKGVRAALHRLSNSRLVCNEELICMSGLTRHSISPWSCFYPWLLLYNLSNGTWEWSSQPLGEKTWSNYDTICLLNPTFEAALP